MPGDNEGSSTELDEMRTTMAALAKSVTNISNLVGNLASSNQNTQQSIQQLNEALSSNFSRKETPKEEFNFEDVDMSSVAKHIIDQVKQITTQSAESLRNELQETKNQTLKSERTKELNALLEQHKDSEEWLTEMRDLAQQNQNLSVNQLYRLARSENPEKASELDEKYKPKEEKEAEVFAGLTPTSKHEFITNTPSSEKVSIKQGLLQAWDEIVPGGMKKLSAESDPFA